MSMSKERLEAFSDGIFAVALTLLVLDLHVPDIANHSSFSQYVKAVIPLFPNVISFILSFATIAVHWVSHHYLFRRLKGTPLGLVWLNNFFLLWICFMPFPTAMIGEHPTDEFPILLYGVNQLLAALTFLSFRSYVKSRKLFINNAAEKEMGPRHSLPAIIIFTLSILLAFVNVYLSLLCFFLVPLLYFIPNMMDVKIKI